MAEHDYDEELAALLALDALEPDEQADAELRLGTFPSGFADTAVALASAISSPAPADLRESTLAHAVARRAPGRPVDAVGVCTPDVAFERTLVELSELLDSLTPDEWNVQVHEDHGRARDLIAHLVGVERLLIRWLDPDETVPYLPDHVASTREVVASLADVDPHEVARQWRESALAMLAAARANRDRQVTFHDLQLSVDGMLTTRTFELWAHGMDIALATDRPLSALDPERMALMSSRLMNAMPGALAYRRSMAPGRTARFVLTGPSGGTYLVPLAFGETAGEPDFTIVADTVDICLVAARRLQPGELRAVIEGDHELAAMALAAMDAFARD